MIMMMVMTTIVTLSIITLTIPVEKLSSSMLP